MRICLKCGSKTEKISSAFHKSLKYKCTECKYTETFEVKFNCFNKFCEHGKLILQGKGLYKKAEKEFNDYLYKCDTCGDIKIYDNEL